MKPSFERTFIREDRGKLFLKGIVNTMTMTLLPIFFGMILGFTTFIFCMTGSKIANAITKAGILNIVVRRLSIYHIKKSVL